LKKSKQGPWARSSQAKAIQELESSLEEDADNEDIEVLDVIEVVHFRC